MEPLVSILIPAYNAQQWLAEAIRSALGQTWRRKEVVVVDDGSTDQTLQVAKEFASKSVRVVTQANQGASVARNTAFANCQGDYIQWLDADDLLEPDKIEQQVRALADCPSPRTLLSGAWGHFIYRKRKALFKPTPLWSDLTPTEWLLRKLGQNLQMQTDNWLVSRELAIAAGPWDRRLWRDNDGEYFCRVIVASDGIRFVPEAKSYYRSAGFNSVSYIGWSNKKLESYFLSMKLHIGYLRSLEDSERSRLACLDYIRAKAYQFYPERLDIVQELAEITSELGGQYQEPSLSWKYDWMVKVFGWSLARQAQVRLPQAKALAIITWDKAMFRLENLTKRKGLES
jgi:glycosyltransferase involved in cell wall biosynthesis